MELTYDEIVDILDVKYVPASTNGYTLPPAEYENIDIILIIKLLLPNELKVNDTIGDVRIRSNSTTIKRIRFTTKSFFYRISRFTQSYSED